MSAFCNAFSAFGLQRKNDEATTSVQNSENKAVQTDTADGETASEDTKRFDVSWDGRSYILELMTQTKYAPDPRSAALLEVIMEGVDYDLGFICNIGELRNILTQSVPDRRTNNYASNFARKQKKAQAALEELMLQFKD